MLPMEAQALCLGVAVLIVPSPPARVDAQHVACAGSPTGAPGRRDAIRHAAIPSRRVFRACRNRHAKTCVRLPQDNLLPAVFARLSTRFRTPWIGCILVCGISAVLAALFPLSILGDFVSIGTALAFIIVALSLMWLRTTRPDIHRPFRVPLGGFRIGRVWVGYIPTAAIVLCVAMVLPIALDIVDSARHGNVLPAAILGGYACLGVLIYSFFGMKGARLVREAASEDGQGAAENA